MKIESASLEILKTPRGFDTLKATVESGGMFASASVPAGISKGRNEVFTAYPANALRDFGNLRNKLAGVEFGTQEEFDRFLIKTDGTPNKQNIGGNVTLALSVAFAKLLSQLSGIELFEHLQNVSGIRPAKFPFLFFNFIEGGMHGNKILPFQEYLFVPVTNSPFEAYSHSEQYFEKLKADLYLKYGVLRVGAEGGLLLNSSDPESGISSIEEISDSKLLPHKYSVDAAATTFYENGKYYLAGQETSAEKLMDVYLALCSKYDLISIEDPFSDTDYESFSKLLTAIGDKVWIVGDDLTTTNVYSMKIAKEHNALNAVVIKPNQIGTVTETIEAVRLAKQYNWKVLVSHRGNDTEDTFITDLAYAVEADGLKAGNQSQKEREVKYKRLIDIEKNLK